MSFQDTKNAADTRLRDRVKLETEEGEWVTGKVVELSLLGDDMTDIGITLLLDTKSPSGHSMLHRFNRKPGDPVVYDI